MRKQSRKLGHSEFHGNETVLGTFRGAWRAGLIASIFARCVLNMRNGRETTYFELGIAPISPL